MLAAAEQRLPLLLKGPTGCGKTRFVHAMGAELGRPVITVACNEDTSATDLVGRFIVQGGDTVWHDGPLTRAVKSGAILYLDEISEAREDVIVLIHPLTDFRREIYIDKLDQRVAAPSEFMLVISFNPGYQSLSKQLKPSTRQRFVAVCFDYPNAEAEAEIVAHESLVELETARRLTKLAHRIRTSTELALEETASTRLLVNAGLLMRAGLQPREACRRAVAEALSDDSSVIQAISDLTALIF